MTNGQEIRAKALEIAVHIIGEQHRTEFKEIHTDDDGYITDAETVRISLIDHYRALAGEIEMYIRGEEAG